jgi:pyrimidine operon attenuation protein/uracil phosphoribosyltransferase
MEQTKKPESLCEERVDLGPVVPPCVTYDEHRRDVQEEQVDTVCRNGEPAVDNVDDMLIYVDDMLIVGRDTSKLTD